MASKTQKKRGALLPDPVQPYDLVCVSFRIPNDRAYRIVIEGFIANLQKAYFWEMSYEDDDNRASEAAQYFKQIFDEYPLEIGECPEPCPECPECPECPDCEDDDCGGCGCDDDDETPESPDDCGCDDDEQPEEPETPEDEEEDMFIGTIIGYASRNAPTKANQLWVRCDGQSYPRASYPEFWELFSALRDSADSFHVPNLMDRFILGGITDPLVDYIDDEGGEDFVTLTEAQIPSHTHVQNSHTHVQDAHNHTQNAHNHTQASHLHGVSSVNNGAIGSNAILLRSNAASGINTNTNSQTPAIDNATATNQATTATNQATTATNQNTGGGGAHNNMPPYRVIPYYIRIK